MTTIDVNALKRQISDLKDEWVNYSLQNQVALLSGETMAEEHITKLVSLQDQINDLEETITRYQGYTERTTLLFTDTYPPTDEDTTLLNIDEYKAHINQVEDRYNKIIVRLKIILTRDEFQLIKFDIIENIGKSYQAEINRLIRIANTRYTENIPLRKIYDSRVLSTMFHMPPRPTRYEFDPSGALRANKCTETRTIQNTNNDERRFILPTHTPFFVDSLSIERTTPTGEKHELFINEDFIVSGLFGEMSEYTLGGKLVGTTILFDDPEIDGTFTITYQTLGGEYTLDDRQYAEVLANYLEHPFLKTYGEIIGKPITLHPMRHNIHVDDLVGLNAFMPVLANISENLRLLREQNNSGLNQAVFDNFIDATQKLKDSTSRMLENLDSIQNKITDNFNSLTDSIGAVERGVRMDLNDAMSELSNRNNGILNELRSEITESLTERMNETGDRLSENLNGRMDILENRVYQRTIPEIERRLDALPTEQRTNELIDDKLTKKFTPYDTKLTELLNKVDGVERGARMDLNDARDDLWARTERLGSDIREGVERNITHVKEEIRRDTDRNIERSLARNNETILGEINTINNNLQNKVSINDPRYVQYRGPGELTDIARIEFGEAGNGTRHLFTTSGIVEYNFYLDPQYRRQERFDGINISPNAVVDNDIFVKSSSDKYFSVKDLFLITHQHNGILNTVNENVQRVNSLLPSTDDVNGKLLQINQQGDVTVPNRLYVGTNLILQHDNGALYSNKPVYSSDMFVDFNNGTSTTRKYSVTNFIRQSTDKLTSLENRLDSLAEQNGNAATSFESLGNRLSSVENTLRGVRDRVQQSEDYRTFSTAINKAPLLQSNGRIYLGSELIIPKPDNQGGYSVNDTDTVKLTYGSSQDLGGVVLDINRPVRMPNFAITSDVRVKEDIQPIQDSQEKLKQITGYTYTLTETKIKSAGLLAQEVKEVLPELVSEDEDGRLSVQYHGIIALLVNVVKEQNLRIETLERQIRGIQND